MEITRYIPRRWPTQESFTIVNLDEKIWGKYEARLHAKVGTKQKSSEAQRNWQSEWMLVAQENIDDMALDVKQVARRSDSIYDNFLQVTNIVNKVESSTLKLEK